LAGEAWGTSAVKLKTLQFLDIVAKLTNGWDGRPSRKPKTEVQTRGMLTIL
jgi:hypothetical protein